MQPTVAKSTAEKTPYNQLSDIPGMSPGYKLLSCKIAVKSAESFSEMTPGLWDDNGRLGWNL